MGLANWLRMRSGWRFALPSEQAFLSKLRSASLSKLRSESQSRQPSKMRSALEQPSKLQSGLRSKWLSKMRLALA